MKPAGTPLTCREMVDRLEDYVDRSLEPHELERVEAHLAHCLECATEYRFEAGLLSAIRERLQRIAMPEDMFARIKARLNG